eukprot:IDg13537t1
MTARMCAPFTSEQTGKTEVELEFDDSFQCGAYDRLQQLKVMLFCMGLYAQPRSAVSRSIDSKQKCGQAAIAFGKLFPYEAWVKESQRDWQSKRR